MTGVCVRAFQNIPLESPCGGNLVCVLSAVGCRQCAMLHCTKKRGLYGVTAVKLAFAAVRREERSFCHGEVTEWLKVPAC